MDFVFNRFASRHADKRLAIVDEATQEAVAATPEQAIYGIIWL